MPSGPEVLDPVMRARRCTAEQTRLRLELASPSRDRSRPSGSSGSTASEPDAPEELDRARSSGSASTSSSSRTSAHSGQRTKLDHYSDHFHVAVHDCVLIDERASSTREIDVVFGDGLAAVRPPGARGHDGRRVEPFPMRRSSSAGSSSQRASTGAPTRDSCSGRSSTSSSTATSPSPRRRRPPRRRRGRGARSTTTATRLATRDDAARAQLFDLGKALMRFRRAAVPLARGRRPRSCAARSCRASATLALVHFQDLVTTCCASPSSSRAQRDVLTGLRDAELAVVVEPDEPLQQQHRGLGRDPDHRDADHRRARHELPRRRPRSTGRTASLVVAGVDGAARRCPCYIYFKRKDWI